MGEGEFKKCIDKDSFKTTWYSAKMTHSYNAILSDHMKDLLDEAKREYLAISGRVAQLDLDTYEGEYYAKELEEKDAWFKKYFGGDGQSVH